VREALLSYCVRLLVKLDKVIPFSEIKNQGKWIKLVSGTDALWDRIEIREPEDNLICILERHYIPPGQTEASEIARLREFIRSGYPVNARDWIREYFYDVKAVYTFAIFPEDITREGWRVLGRIQSLLHDWLVGLIQADHEGFYNESGDYILWQMYPGASGTVQAASLSQEGKWISYPLRLDNTQAVARFKEGVPPPKRFLGRLKKG
jgi:hypothetical protein